MKFTADIQIIPLPEIYEPQGQTVLRHLDKLQIKGVNQLRIGKFVTLELTAEDETAAQKTVEKICQKLLAHPLVETYNFQLKAIEEPVEDIAEETDVTEITSETSVVEPAPVFTANHNEEE